jgi:two-component system response regulator DesR
MVPDERRDLRVLIVDDHDVVHWGFRMMLGGLQWVERCLPATDGETACALAAKHNPHVALVDLFVGTESGADICVRILTVAPSTNVLLISGAGRISPTAARAVGASGFVTKDLPAEDIARAVRMVGLGMDVFPETEQDGGNPLSAREVEVLEAVAAGRTNREIAAELYLSPHTVKDHVSAVLKKIGARNRAEAVQRAQRLGLLG